MTQQDYVLRDLKIRQKAVFDLKELYKIMHNWLKFYGYIEFNELDYLEKDEENGKHIEIRWLALKKADDYVKFAIEIQFRIANLKDITIEKDNKKVKSSKGEISLNFKAYLLKDYEDVWEKRPGVRFMREAYDKFVIKGKLERYEKDLADETHKLMSEVKSFLNMRKYT